jgi:hypothetical protein
VVSVILTVHQRYELELPTLWRELPPTSVLASDGWRFEWVDELSVTVDRKETLLESLSYAAAFVMDKMDDGRSWVAIIDPVLGLVRATASIATIPLTDDSVYGYLDVAAPRLPLSGAIVWNTQNTEATLGGHPAIVLHELGAYNFEENGASISERYVGTVFPDAGNTAVQLEILAEDTTVFADIVAAGNAVLDGLRFALDQD